MKITRLGADSEELTLGSRMNESELYDTFMVGQKLEMEAIATPTLPLLLMRPGI